MTQHAIFSPSATDRWLACPGSITLTEQLESDSGGHSIYTAEGTTIHALAEQVLQAKYVDRQDPQPILAAAPGKPWSDYADGLDSFGDNEVTPEMVWQAQTYLEAVDAIVQPQDTVGIETRVTMNAALFGTIDLLVHTRRGEVYLVDLKTGSGKEVSAKENPQLMTYASCWAAQFPDLAATVHTYHLVIVQPPFEPAVSSHAIGSARVQQHTEQLLQTMYKVETGIAARTPGDHCRWCPARAACPTLRERADHALSRSFDGLQPAEWDELLLLADQLEPWCKSVRERAQLAAEQGIEIPNRKLVRRYGRTTWADEDQAENTLLVALEHAGVHNPILRNPGKLRTPPQLKKELKEHINKDVIDELTYTPDRGVMLTTADDKREAIEPLGGKLKSLGEQLKASGI